MWSVASTLGGSCLWLLKIRGLRGVLMLATSIARVTCPMVNTTAVGSCDDTGVVTNPVTNKNAHC